MRILVKIILTFVVIIITALLNAVFMAAGESTTPVIRLIPATLMIGGIIGVWRYKPSKKNNDNKDLDKTI